jgi:TrmH family RNA methyltransferase
LSTTIIRAVTRLSSTSNPRVLAAVRALSRGARVPVEGARLLEEALDAGARPDTVFHTDGGAPDGLLRRAAASGAELVEVSASVLQKLSDLPSTRGCVALAPPLEPRLEPLGARDLALLLDGVQDPTNVGAIVRTAEALGAASIVTTAGSASPFTARALRVSAGSAFRLPIASGLPPADALAWARRGGAVLAGAEAHGGDPPEALAGIRPLVLVVGSEGHGISSQLERALDRRVTIPLAASVESLNAAAATAVLLYALGSPKTSAAKR